MRNICSIINARVASTRCPRKLVRNFCGTTLLDIALSKMSQLSLQEKYIAAGDEEIIEIAKKYNEIKILYRDKDAISAGEHHHSVSFRHYGLVNSDYILVFNPCLPSSKIDTYQNAISFFDRSTNSKTLTSVIKMNDIFFDENSKCFTLNDNNHISSKTTKPIYKMAHMFHFFNKKSFLETGKFWDYSLHNPDFLEVDKYDCFDIDDEEDFTFCEKLYK